jgi:hypothetical protein
MIGQKKNMGQEYRQWIKNRKTKKTKQGRTGVKNLDKNSDCP